MEAEAAEDLSCVDSVEEAVKVLEMEINFIFSDIMMLSSVKNSKKRNRNRSIL